MDSADDGRVDECRRDGRHVHPPVRSRPEPLPSTGQAAWSCPRRSARRRTSSPTCRSGSRSATAGSRSSPSTRRSASSSPDYAPGFARERRPMQVDTDPTPIRPASALGQTVLAEDFGPRARRRPQRDLGLVSQGRQHSHRPERPARREAWCMVGLESRDAGAGARRPAPAAVRVDGPGAPSQVARRPHVDPFSAATQVVPAPSRTFACVHPGGTIHCPPSMLSFT